MLVSNVNVENDDRWISLTCDWFSSRIRVILVYAPNTLSSQQELWEELKELLSFDGSILMLGEYNQILKPDESQNCNAFTSSMLNF